MTDPGHQTLYVQRIAESGDNGGPEIVWLHGWGQSHESLRDLAKGLRGLASHLLIDLPGFGRTPPLHHGADTTDYAHFLIAHLDDPTGSRFLAGHSFGARVATRIAGRSASGIDGLILIAAAGLKRERSVAWKIKAAALKFLGRAAGAADHLFGTEWKEAYRCQFGSADYRNAGRLRQTLVKTVSEDLTEVAKRIQCPVLVIYGADDTETPAELGSKWKDLIPHAELHVLPGFGHLDILGPGRHQCDSLIRKFIRRHANA